MGANMISILDPRKFESFGRPARSFDTDDFDSLSAGSDPPLTLSVSEGKEVLLDVQEGLPILLVANRDREDLFAFLLDRPVFVDVGVSFAVFALDGTCRYGVSPENWSRFLVSIEGRDARQGGTGSWHESSTRRSRSS